jgi:predicted nucleotidyltransferase
MEHRPPNRKPMAKVQTLEERKRARVEEIRAGFARLREELADYGRGHGGKFWVYGSAATDRLRFDSDIDILADFGDADRVAALDFVESACARLGLRCDVQPRAWCSPAFIARIAANALILP